MQQQWQHAMWQQQLQHLQFVRQQQQAQWSRHMQWQGRNEHRLQKQEQESVKQARETEAQTHFDVRESEEFKKMAIEYGYRSYSITRYMRRFDHGSGGVTVLVCEDLRSKEVKKSKHEDMLWVCVEGECILYRHRRRERGKQKN